MARKSEEGKCLGLNWIDAEVNRLSFYNSTLKIPHMGWITLNINNNNLLYKDFDKEIRVYFVHSYHVVCENSDEILTTTLYGDLFTSSFQKDNILGVQFHPEKSHKFGMKILKNFVDM